MNVKFNFDGSPKILEGIRSEMELFSDRLFERAYDTLASLQCVGYVTREPVPFEERLSGTAVRLATGDQWATDTFDCAWFHVTGRLPEGYAPEDLVLQLNCGGEGLVYDGQGQPVQGITCYASCFEPALGTPRKEIVPLYDQLHQGDLVDFWIDCGANDLFGNMADRSRVGNLCIARQNKEIRSLAYDVQILLGVADYADAPAFRDQILAAIGSVMKNAEFTEAWAASCRRTLAPLLQTKNEGSDVFNFSGVGHAHLDLAWLWPLRETKRKGARTFATQLRNIEKYPDYIFGASQAQLYQWIKEEYPSLYAQVQKAAQGPNWDVQGSTWVEMDSNLISGESMVRQFYYGKEFFRNELGQDNHIFWVPDSFGYSGCLPQVMKLAEVPYFLTMKLSWSLYNKFPYHTFHWKGIDGSEVFAHMLPEDTYNAPCRPDSLISGEKNYRERKISDMALSAIGIGDGGAGPGYEHIERAMRQKDLRGVPRFRFEKSGDFFARLDNPAIAYPSFQGELYLERHQGTYTTQSASKRYNRLCEFLLRNYEVLYCMAQDQGLDVPVSGRELEELWKEILLYQFHDILPGSSINRVYEESVARYEIISNKLKNSIELLAAQLFRGQGFVNFNAYRYSRPMKLDGRWVTCQVAPFGFTPKKLLQPIREFHAACTAQSIENDKVCVTFDRGLISKLFNKQLNRQFVPEDHPMGLVSQYTDNGDCWDMEGTKADYRATRQDSICTGFHTFTDGAKACAQCSYTVGDCKIEQTFYILDGDATVYCDLKLDVHQQAKMLRIEFPTNLQAEEAAFNIQYGHINRRMTENNSVELAQFEVSGQKFVDISEDTLGLSLVNDCKYGYRVKHGVIDVNLVRSPKGGPGTNVDQGEQTVHFALVTHEGPLGAETYRKAYEINNPVVEINSCAGCETATQLYTGSNDAVILETVKEPRDGNGIITRFYNTSAEPQTATVSLAGYRMAEVVNILEKPLEEKTDGVLHLHGFELINLRWVKE